MSFSLRDTQILEHILATEVKNDIKMYLELVLYLYFGKKRCFMCSKCRFKSPTLRLIQFVTKTVTLGDKKFVYWHKSMKYEVSEAWMNKFVFTKAKQGLASVQEGFRPGHGLQVWEDRARFFYILKNLDHAFTWSFFAAAKHGAFHFHSEKKNKMQATHISKQCHTPAIGKPSHTYLV